DHARAAALERVGQVEGDDELVLDDQNSAIGEIDHAPPSRFTPSPNAGTSLGCSPPADTRTEPSLFLSRPSPTRSVPSPAARRLTPTEEPTTPIEPIRQLQGAAARRHGLHHANSSHAGSARRGAGPQTPRNDHRPRALMDMRGGDDQRSCQKWPRSKRAAKRESGNNKSNVSSKNVSAASRAKCRKARSPATRNGGDQRPGLHVVSRSAT